MFPLLPLRLRSGASSGDAPGPAWPRGCWPTDEQRLLLRACLLADVAAAQAAFREWERRVPLFCVDNGSAKLLLCLYERLKTWDVPYAELERLKGLARYRWIYHQSLSRELGAILHALHGAGIDTLLLKGAALNLTVYPQGQRLMSDIDVAVPRPQAVAALRVLTAHGRRPGYPDPERLVETGMECPFGEAARGHLDLHWDFFHGRYLNAAAQRELWDAARTVTVGDAATRVLCPADQLLHVCEHGLRESEAPPFRWLADACQILRHSGDALDWDRLASLAERHDLLLPVRHTLDYLERHLEIAPPPAARQRLHRPRVRWRSRLAYAVTTRRLPGAHPFWHRLPVNFIDWRRIRRTNPQLSFADHLQSTVCLFPTVREHIPHLLRLQWRALGIGVMSGIGRVLARLRPGRSGGRIAVSQLPEPGFDGCYSLEAWSDGLVRWTRPVGVVQLPLTPDAYEITLQLAPLRPWFHDLQLTLHIRWNRHVVPREQCRFENWCVTFPIEREMFMDFERQRLELRCTEWSETALDDPRQLGVPLSAVEWRVRRPAMPPLRQRLHLAARRVGQRVLDVGRTAWTAVTSPFVQWARSIAARFGPGLQPARMDAADIPPYLLTGFHPVEDSDYGPLRWTTPAAGVYWRVRPGAYRVALRLAPVRPWKGELQPSLRIVVNGTALPPEAIQFQKWQVSFDVGPELLTPRQRQRLELRCDAWVRPADIDPRPLGLPLLDMQWTPHREAA